MRVKLFGIVGSLLLCLTALSWTPAQADSVDPGGGSTTIADCHAYVGTLAKSGDSVKAVLTVSCNVYAKLISIYGGLSRSNDNRQVQGEKRCYDAASCSLTLLLPNPAGTQTFRASFAPSDTFVSWPNFTDMPWLKLDSSSSSMCPDMGCRMVSISA